MNHLTVSIPAYNEEKNIIPLIYDILDVCEQIGTDFQIFIVNDGSTDDTEAVIQQHFAGHSRISIHRHLKNMGFGQTISDCFTIPDSEWIMNLSGDNQFPAENIRIMFEQTGSYEVILGNRTRRHDNLYRKLVSKIYNRIVSKMAGVRINDVSSILLVKKALIRNTEFKSTSGFIHTEIALEALKHSSRFTEVDLLHKEREYGTASGGKLRTILSTISEMIKYVLGIL